MCSQETLNKIDKGTHIVVPKKAGWFLGILGTISPLGFIAAVFWLGSFAEKADGRMLDGPEQKKEVIDFVKKGHPVNAVQIDNILEHSDDADVHMNFQEKRTMFLLEDRQATIISNQTKIGQDLEEIKNLIRNK